MGLILEDTVSVFYALVTVLITVWISSISKLCNLSSNVCLTSVTVLRNSPWSVFVFCLQPFLKLATLSKFRSQYKYEFFRGFFLPHNLVLVINPQAWVKFQNSLTVIYPRYGTRLFDDEAQVQEFSDMWGTPSLPLLPGPLWTEVIEFLGGLSVDQIELFKNSTVCKQIIDVKLSC